MKRQLYNAITIVAAAALSLTSCVKDDLHNTPNPDKGSVIVAPDWSDALAVADIPPTYILAVDGGEAKPAAGESAAFPELLTPGQHQLLVYNQPQGITINATTARIDKLADGTATPLPGYLFSAIKSFTVVADSEQTIAVPMKRLICPVAIILTLDGDNVGAIADVKASLSGLAGSVDLQSGKIDGSVAMNLPVERTANLITLRCRTFGPGSSDKQTLTVTVTMADGHTETAVSDLTFALKDLQTQMAPIEIKGSLTAPQDGHFVGTITDWTSGNGSGESGDAK